MTPDGLSAYCQNLGATLFGWSLSIASGHLKSWTLVDNTDHTTITLVLADRRVVRVEGVSLVDAFKNAVELLERMKREDRDKDFEPMEVR